MGVVLLLLVQGNQGSLGCWQGLVCLLLRLWLLSLAGSAKLLGLESRQFVRLAARRLATKVLRMLVLKLALSLTELGAGWLELAQLVHQELVQVGVVGLGEEVAVLVALVDCRVLGQRKSTLVGVMLLRLLLLVLRLLLWRLLRRVGRELGLALSRSGALLGG